MLACTGVAIVFMPAAWAYNSSTRLGGSGFEDFDPGGRRWRNVLRKLPARQCAGNSAEASRPSDHADSDVHAAAHGYVRCEYWRGVLRRRERMVAAFDRCLSTHSPRGRLASGSHLAPGDRRQIRRADLSGEA